MCLIIYKKMFVRKSKKYIIGNGTKSNGTLVNVRRVKQNGTSGASQSNEVKQNEVKQNEEKQKGTKSKSSGVPTAKLHAVDKEFIKLISGGGFKKL